FDSERTEGTQGGGMRRGLWIAVCGFALLGGAPGFGQRGGRGANGDSDNALAAKWDVTQPRGKTREIDFTTTEGTWMSADLSPDGRWIAFDLLGHIYTVPAAG